MWPLTSLLHHSFVWYTLKNSVTYPWEISAIELPSFWLYQHCSIASTRSPQPKNTTVLLPLQYYCLYLHIKQSDRSLPLIRHTLESCYCFKQESISPMAKSDEWLWIKLLTDPFPVSLHYPWCHVIWYHKSASQYMYAYSKEVKYEYIVINYKLFQMA